MNTVRKRTLKDWVIATRPWSFTTSSVSILVTIAYIFYYSESRVEPPLADNVDWLNAFLCLPLLIILHAGGNLVSDYYDYVGGVDGPDCPNGVTWIRSGLFAPKEILCYGLSLLAVGAMLGMVLLWRSSLSAAWLGVVALAVPLSYPFLKAHVLGDLDILIGFALVPAIGTCFVSTGDYHLEMLLFCLPYGFHIVAILHSNNTRDIDNDRKAGLRTLPGKIGWAASRRLYACEILLPYLLVLLFCLGHGTTWWTMITYATLPMALGIVSKLMMDKNGPQGFIKGLDQITAKFQFLFGILYALGFVLGALYGLFLQPDCLC